jgi:TonB family protein
LPYSPIWIRATPGVPGHPGYDQEFPALAFRIVTSYVACSMTHGVSTAVFFRLPLRNGICPRVCYNNSALRGKTPAFARTTGLEDGSDLIMRRTGFSAIPLIVLPRPFWTRVGTFGLLSCLFFSGGITASAQFKEIGPPPVPATVARTQIRALLEKVDPDNRQQTVATISGLLVWYRDLIDEELIAAWQKDGRANLKEVLESLADSHLASAVVDYSWRQQRQTTFIAAYAPMLGHLMARYPDSAKPFLDDLPGSAATSTATSQHTLDLSRTEAETVCRILLDMPDIGTWKKSALQILPHYRQDAENLLVRDLQGGDWNKSNRAQLWLTDLKAIDPAFDVQRAAALTPPDLSALSAPKLTDGSRLDADVLARLPAKRAGVILTPLNPVTVDDTMASINGAIAAAIDFVNRSDGSVDIYWIDYKGNRVVSIAGLAVGATFSGYTYLTHPFLVVVSGTGGTTARDTGMRLTAFQAVTPRNALDPSIRDTAIITNPDGTSAKGANPVPAPAGAGTAGTDGVYRIGGGVSQPSVLTRVYPDYSEVARKLGIDGRVTLSFVIDPAGAARELKAVKPLGYGLDEKAMEAVRKWRFKPGMKDGTAVPVRASAELPFTLGERRPDKYYPGPMAFAPGSGVTPPVITDGTMPKPAGDKSNESVVLEFTVDFTGAVNNIHFMSGSQSASALLSRSLATWKFKPAMKGDQPVEATGTVSFVKGLGTEAAKLPLLPPVPQSNPAPAKKVKDQAEYNIMLAVTKDLQNKNGARAIRDLDVWNQKYPDSDYRNEREFRYLQAYEIAGESDKLLDKVKALMGQNLVALIPDPVERQEVLNVLLSATGHVLASEKPSPGQIAIASQLSQQLRDYNKKPEGVSNGTNPVPTSAGAGATDPGGVSPTGEKASPATLISQAKPEYPALAKLLRAEGVVSLSVAIQPDGTVRDLKVLRSAGYGLDEKAMEAVQKWRYAPTRLNGSPVSSVSTVFANFTLDGPRNVWHSGPMTFVIQAGIAPPAVTGGTMPKPDQEIPEESVVLGFTVDSSGAVKNIHSTAGSQSASELLTRSLATWKFRPAMKGDQPVEATGTVSFIKGQPDQAGNKPPEPVHAPATEAGPVRTMVNATDGQRYVWIPPGAFTMGCSQGDTECDNGEKPPRAERIAGGFWLGQTEVTQAAYLRVTGGNPSTHKGDQLPVETLAWNHAVNYCKAIGGRLPTEAEWEYAARAGVGWARYGSLDAVAWFSGNSGGITHPVALKQPNAFGLYDMLGNVWEWVEDSGAGAATRILRGGASLVDATQARASRRWIVDPVQGTYRGVRCVVTGAGPASAEASGSGIGSRDSAVSPSGRTVGPDGADGGAVYKVGGGVSPPAVIFKVDPEYSEEARKAKYSGSVGLFVIVDAEGNPQDIQVSKSLGLGLDEKAIEAVQKWKFKPAMKDGQPVNVRISIEVLFRLL